MKKRFLTCVVLAVFAALLFLPACTGERDTSGRQDSAAQSSPAQRISSIDFSLPLAGSAGENLALSDLRGQVVLLNFWATWCPACSAERPSLQTLYNHYREEGLTVLAVNIGESPAQVQAFVEDNGIPFPVVLDMDRNVSFAHGVHGIPTSFIIDREGYIVGRMVGPVDWDSPQVHAAFQELLE